jgi:glycyl-tRNA synthetase alpha chain
VSSPTFQEIVFVLKKNWSDRGCVIQEPYDVELGARTMTPETLRKRQQLQAILKPSPAHVINQYLR